MISRRTFLHRGSLAIVGLVALPLAACGGDDNQSYTVRMGDSLIFEPNVLRIKSGETVQWRNEGNVPHSVTTTAAIVADPTQVLVPDGAEPWDSGLIQAGASWEQTFNVIGEYRYVCMPHEAAGITGTLIVEA